MRRFWPAREAAQADYEVLREVVQAGGASVSVAAQRFERRGLAGLIAWPAADAAFFARLSGAVRPAGVSGSLCERDPPTTTVGLRACHKECDPYGSYRDVDQACWGP